MPRLASLVLALLLPSLEGADTCRQDGACITNESDTTTMMQTLVGVHINRGRTDPHVGQAFAVAEETTEEFKHEEYDDTDDDDSPSADLSSETLDDGQQLNASFVQRQVNLMACPVFLTIGGTHYSSLRGSYRTQAVHNNAPVWTFVHDNGPRYLQLVNFWGRWRWCVGLALNDDSERNQWLCTHSDPGANEMCPDDSALDSRWFEKRPPDFRWFAFSGDPVSSEVSSEVSRDVPTFDWQGCRCCGLDMQYGFRPSPNTATYMDRAGQIFNLLGEDVGNTHNPHSSERRVHSDVYTDATSNVATSMSLEAEYSGAFSAAVSAQVSTASRSHNTGRIIGRSFQAWELKSTVDVNVDKDRLWTKVRPTVWDQFHSQTPSEIVERFGEFFATQMGCGGTVRFDFRQRETYANQESDFAASIQASGGGLTGSASASVQHSSSQSLTNSQFNMDVERSTTGGAWPGTRTFNEGYPEWLRTIDASPGPISFALHPIWELVRQVDAEKGAEVQSYLEGQWQMRADDLSRLANAPIYLFHGSSVLLENDRKELGTCGAGSAASCGGHNVVACARNGCAESSRIWQVFKVHVQESRTDSTPIEHGEEVYLRLAGGSRYYLNECGVSCNSVRHVGAHSHTRGPSWTLLRARGNGPISNGDGVKIVTTSDQRRGYIERYSCRSSVCGGGHDVHTRVPGGNDASRTWAMTIVSR